MVRSVGAEDEGQSTENLAVEFDLPAEEGFWIAARGRGANPLQVAHTTPVYVTVNGGGFHNPSTARENLAL
ncbi:MAG: hypothetical protein WD342_17835 [Verrucomicrobiales bacterium]